MAPRKPTKKKTSTRRPRLRVEVDHDDVQDDYSEGYYADKTWLQRLIHFGVVLGIWIGIGVAIFVAYCALTLPDLKNAEGLKRKPSLVVLAADGSTIAEYGERSAAPIKLSELPPYVPNALMAVEDRRFYSHMGVDPLGLLRAFGRNLVSGRTVQGGSTITQQLAKNLFLTPDRTMKRKVQEMLIAFWLERTYTKDQILESYLNRVYFGAGAFGVEAAAQTYFGKPASRVNIREAALLAGLLKAPSRYSPKSDPDEAAARTEVVLAAMKEAGFITSAESRTLKKLPPMNKQRLAIQGEGRYFTDWVVDQAKDIVGDREVDLVITTTLDRSLQRDMEVAVKRTLDRDGAESRVSQAAAVLLSNDGAVKALTGGRDYQESQFNRAIQAQRQPGSSFKPFVYLVALQQGMTPDTITQDAPRRYGRWTPENYDGKYHGEVTLRTALANSYNTVAVSLLDQVGVARVKRTAQLLGITSTLPNDLSLALGSGEVSPYDLTAAYAALANGGEAVAPYGISEIREAAADGKGDVLYRHRAVTMPRVVDATAVATLTSMMESVVTSGTGKAAQLDRDVAGKTGTSSDYRDAWFVGFTHDHTLGVWVGNDNNQPMRKVTGGGIPARLWHDIMASASAGLPAQALNTGSGGSFIGQLFDSGDTEAPAPASSDAPAPANDNSGGSFGGMLGRLLGGDKAPQPEAAYPATKGEQ